MSKVHNQIISKFTSVFEDALESHGGKGVYGGFVGVNGKGPFDAAFDKVKAQIKKAYDLERIQDEAEMMRARADRQKEKDAAASAALKAEREQAEYEEILSKRKKQAQDEAREKALIAKFEKGE